MRNSIKGIIEDVGLLIEGDLNYATALVKINKMHEIEISVLRKIGEYVKENNQIPTYHVATLIDKGFPAFELMLSLHKGKHEDNFKLFKQALIDYSETKRFPSLIRKHTTHTCEIYTIERELLSLTQHKLKKLTKEKVFIGQNMYDLLREKHVTLNYPHLKAFLIDPKGFLLRYVKASPITAQRNS